MILKPDYIADTLFDIDFDELFEKGVRVVLFDLDSTIMASKSGKYADETKIFLKKLEERFTLCVISNNTNEEYLVNVRNITPFRVIGNAKKPCFKAMSCYLDEIEKKASEAVVIGDRPLTDILAGKRLGAYTVLVDSITKDTEHKIVRFVRFLERLTISRK